MKQDWTKEPVIVGRTSRTDILKPTTGELVAQCQKPEDTIRLTACYNACAGLSNEDLKLVKEVEAMKDFIDSFVKWAEITAQWDKLGQTYYNAKEIINRIEKGE